MKLLATTGALGLASSMVALACLGDDPERVETRPDLVADAAAEAAAEPAGQSILDRGDFESGGCLGWTANTATLNADITARSGVGACRVCDADAESVWGIFQLVPEAAPGRYVARAYVRTHGTVGPTTVELTLARTKRSGEQLGEVVAPVTIAPNDATFTEVAAQIDVGPDEGVAVGVMATTFPGCFLVDDVTLVKE